MGRPSKLTPELQDEICTYIRDDSVPLVTACGAVGITPRTMQYWMAAGEKAASEWTGDDEPERGTPASFFRDVTRAQALAEIEDIKRARRGDDRGESNGRARCAQWMLERTRSKRFSPQVNVKVEQEMAVFLDVLAAVLPTDQYAAVLGAIEDVDDDGIPRVLTAGVVDAESNTEH